MTGLELNERREEDRRALDRQRPSVGLGEWVRWGIMLALAGIVSYFTVVNEVGRVDEREKGHFDELLRVVNEIKTDVRELRKHP